MKIKESDPNMILPDEFGGFQIPHKGQDHLMSSAISVSGFLQNKFSRKWVFVRLAVPFNTPAIAWPESVMGGGAKQGL